MCLCFTIYFDILLNNTNSLCLRYEKYIWALLYISTFHGITIQYITVYTMVPTLYFIRHYAIISLFILYFSLQPFLYVIINMSYTPPQTYTYYIQKYTKLFSRFRLLKSRQKMSELNLGMNRQKVIVPSPYEQVLSFIEILTSRFKDCIVNRVI